MEVVVVKKEVELVSSAWVLKSAREDHSLSSILVKPLGLRWCVGIGPSEAMFDELLEKQRAEVPVATAALVVTRVEVGKPKRE